MQADSLPRSIPALVLASAERFGQASAIEDGETRFSYQELGVLTLRAARACVEARDVSFDPAAAARGGRRAVRWAHQQTQLPLLIFYCCS